MHEVKRVLYRKLEIVVKSKQLALPTDGSIVTRYFAEIRNWGDLPLYRTQATAGSPEEAIEEAKTFLTHRN